MNLNAWENNYEEIMKLQDDGTITEQEALDLMISLTTHERLTTEEEHEKYLKSLGLYNTSIPPIDLEDYSGVQMTNEYYQELTAQHEANKRAIQDKHDEAALLHAQQEQIRLEMELKHQARQKLEAEHAAIGKKLKVWQDESDKRQREAAALTQQLKFEQEAEQKRKTAKEHARLIKSIQNYKTISLIEDDDYMPIAGGYGDDEDIKNFNPPYTIGIKTKSSPLITSTKKKKKTEVKEIDNANVVILPDNGQNGLIYKGSTLQQHPAAKWNITTGANDDLVIEHVPSGRVFLKITEEEIIIGDEQGEHIRLGAATTATAVKKSN